MNHSNSWAAHLPFLIADLLSGKPREVGRAHAELAQMALAAEVGTQLLEEQERAAKCSAAQVEEKDKRE
jgi:hypothetical protein